MSQWSGNPVTNPGPVPTSLQQLVEQIEDADEQVNPPALPKSVVKSSTMPPLLIQEVISCSLNAIDENTSDKSIAASIRKALHSKHSRDVELLRRP